MRRKEFESSKAFFVLVVTLIIFAIGVFIGTQLSSQKADTILELSQDLQIQTLGIEVQHDILSENICENDNVLYLTEDLFALAEKLDFMENSLGSDDERVLTLKEYYFVLEAKHWLLARQRAASCLDEPADINASTILYFYSTENECSDCQQQGFTLSYLRRKYDGMKVYSFDINFNTPVTNALKGVYGIGSEAPTLVINDETRVGFHDVDDITQVILDQQAQTEQELLLQESADLQEE